MTANDATGETAVDVELSADNLEDLEAVYRELGNTPGVTVGAIGTEVRPGEQGAALDLLTAALSGGAVASLLNLLGALAKSRGPGFRLSIRRGRDRVELTADNAEEALPALRELLRDS